MEHRIVDIAQLITQLTPFAALITGVVTTAISFAVTRDPFKHLDRALAIRERIDASQISTKAWDKIILEEIQSVESPERRTGRTVAMNRLSISLALLIAPFIGTFVVTEATTPNSVTIVTLASLLVMTIAALYLFLKATWQLARSLDTKWSPLGDVTETDLYTESNRELNSQIVERNDSPRRADRRKKLMKKGRWRQR